MISFMQWIQNITKFSKNHFHLHEKLFHILNTRLIPQFGKVWSIETVCFVQSYNSNTLNFNSTKEQPKLRNADNTVPPSHESCFWIDKLHSIIKKIKRLSNNWEHKDHTVLKKKIRHFVDFYRRITRGSNNISMLPW